MRATVSKDGSNLRAYSILRDARREVRRAPQDDGHQFRPLVSFDVDVLVTFDFREISGCITGLAIRNESMATKSQRRATRTHRRRAAARGLVRVEVQAPTRDARLIRAVAETLRGRAQEAEALRSTLAQALMHPGAKTAFDIFGSDLPDETFAGVFDQPRQHNWRNVTQIGALLDPFAAST